MRRNLPRNGMYFKTFHALILLMICMLGISVYPEYEGSKLQTTMIPKKGIKQYVVFKFDDLNHMQWKTWKTITDIIISKNVTAEIGLFVKSLTLGDADYLTYVQSLVDDPKHFEIWMHGWTGDAKEFLETDYITQKDHFHKARTTMLMKFDYILRNYGQHYWGGNQNTVRIVNEDPYIKGWVYYEQRDENNVYGLKEEKQVMPKLNVHMEPVTGVVSYEKYLTDWLKFKADTLPYVVIQGHPWGYTTDSLRTEFIKVIDDLLAKQVTFTHFNDYYRMLKGYSTDTTPPSVPKRLKASRIDDLQVKLSWKASIDNESGVDCYKIYRDGICIDLSVYPFYTEKITGTHTYRVAAVNRNDLVSEKSKKVVP